MKPTNEELIQNHKEIFIKKIYSYSTTKKTKKTRRKKQQREGTSKRSTVKRKWQYY